MKAELIEFAGGPDVGGRGGRGEEERGMGEERKEGREGRKGRWGVKGESRVTLRFWPDPVVPAGPWTSF